MITFYNFLTRKKETFRPLHKKRVGLYTCGPTVYNYVHIGNLRTYVFQDILRRTLEYSGHNVRHVMNITDVGHLTSDADTGEDKLEAGAQKERKTVWQVAHFYTRAFGKDIKKLNIQKAHVLTPATQHVDKQIRIIKKLLQRKYAYEAPTAVYFHVPKFKKYTKLSGQPPMRQKVGVRAEVVVDKEKRHPADFALWFKLVGRYKNHVLRWPSPWGVGFPGWHVECSAISSHFLGQPFDIHTGGIDLLFPHHTNEIAQSEGAYGKPLARFWIEGEHLLVDGKKMSKSLGNFYTLQDIEAKGFDPLDFRYFLLGAHYRTRLDFSWNALQAARNSRLRAVNTLTRIKQSAYGGTMRDENETLKVVAASLRQFRAAIEDDLNMPRALAVLNELLHYGGALSDKRILTRGASRMVPAAIFEMDSVLGLHLKKNKRAVVPKQILELLKRREDLRQEKRWKEADAIRGLILQNGFVVEDTPHGPVLKAGSNQQRKPA